MQTDFTQKLDYAGYLHLDTLLSAQHPLSDPQHPDELLFVIQHQTTELWLKLMVHELEGARGFLDADDLSRARKSLSRVKHILRTVTEQWSVLATLTPSEYAEFRGVLGPASGFQSVQYRAVEFLLGNKNPQMLGRVQGQPDGARLPRRRVGEPHRLRRVPPAGGPSRVAGACCCPGPRREPRPGSSTPSWCRCSARSTRTLPGYWDLYETSEDLVDVEDAFQLWRFRHLRTVQRTIGFKPAPAVPRASRSSAARSTSPSSPS